MLVSRKLFVIVFVLFSISSYVTAFTCPHENGGNSLHPDKNNCSKYWQCSNGIAYSFDCPAGLNFDNQQQRCEWPEIANCTGGSPSSQNSSEIVLVAEEAPNSNSTRNSTESVSPEPRRLCPVRSVECPEVDDETPVYVPVRNCSQFCQCSNGVLYLHDCPGNLLFNRSLNVCDYPENVDCYCGISRRRRRRSLNII